MGSRVVEFSDDSPPISRENRFILCRAQRGLTGGLIKKWCIPMQKCCLGRLCTFREQWGLFGAGTLGENQGVCDFLIDRAYQLVNLGCRRFLPRLLTY
jgi:hypothetical protein